MSLEILENKKRGTEFNIRDEITNGRYTFGIYKIVTCDLSYEIRAKNKVCAGCLTPLAYISDRSGIQYCSQSNWQRTGSHWR